MSDEQPYQVRCVNCENSFIISHNDGRTKIQTKDTRHNPRSKASRMQKHGSTTCQECDGERFAVKPISL